MNTMELLKTRRSIRKFDQTRLLPDEVVMEIAQSQRYASSAVNGQPLQYILVKDPELTEQIFPYTRWAALLPGNEGKPQDGQHPVLYAVVLYDKNHKTAWTDTDAGLAISNMTFAAWSSGVGSCILGALNKKEIRKLLHIDEDLEIHSLIAFGYPAVQSSVVEPDPDGNLRYYLDENGNFCVPKRRVEETVKIV